MASMSPIGFVLYCNNTNMNVIYLYLVYNYVPNTWVEQLAWPSHDIILRAHMARQQQLWDLTEQAEIV